MSDMRKGYSLVEILVALVIFSFMAVALSGVFATANRFFAHQYREDLFKTRFVTAMKFIQNKMMTANEVLIPAPNNLSGYITFLSNVAVNPSSTNQICRPATALPSMWHYVCRDNGNRLFYHSGDLTISNCPTYTTIWLSNPPTTCGSGSNPVFLSDNISSLVFSRQNLPSNVVRVNMTLFSRAPGSQTSFAGTVGRDITQTFETYISINKVSQF